MKKKLKIAFLVLVVAAVAIQFVPVDRTNPPVKADFDGPADVAKILRESCYDCHSNETRWPLYSRIAPVSWLVASDVEEARGKLNFSEWGLLDARRRARRAEDMADEVKGGDMPPSNYLLMHSDAKLDADRVAAVEAWAATVK